MLEMAWGLRWVCRPLEVAVSQHGCRLTVAVEWGWLGGSLLQQGLHWQHCLLRGASGP